MCVVRIQRDGALQGGLGAGPVPIEEELQHAERRERLATLRVQLQRSCGQHPHLRHDRIAVRVAEVRHRRDDARLRCPRASESRLERDCAVEEYGSLAQLVRLEAVPQVEAAQVQVVCLGGERTLGLRGIVACKSQVQRARDRVRDGVL